jgi:hypothetical protein
MLWSRISFSVPVWGDFVVVMSVNVPAGTDEARLF